MNILEEYSGIKGPEKQKFDQLAIQLLNKDQSYIRKEIEKRKKENLKLKRTLDKTVLKKKRSVSQNVIEVSKRYKGKKSARKIGKKKRLKKTLTM